MSTAPFEIPPQHETVKAASGMKSLADFKRATKLGAIFHREQPGTEPRRVIVVRVQFNAVAFALPGIPIEEAQEALADGDRYWREECSWLHFPRAGDVAFEEGAIVLPSGLRLRPETPTHTNDCLVSPPAGSARQDWGAVMLQHKRGLVILLPLFIIIGVIQGVMDGWNAFMRDWRDAK